LPDSPRTNPGVRNYRTGLFRSIRFRRTLRSTRNEAHYYALGTTYDTWFSNAEQFHQLIKAKPIVTLTLTAPIKKFPQRPDGIEIERIETGEIAIYAKIIIVPTQFHIQCLEQFRYFAVTVFLTPKGEAFLGFAQGLASSALINMRFALSIFAPKLDIPNAFALKGMICVFSADNSSPNLPSRLPKTS